MAQISRIPVAGFEFLRTKGVVDQPPPVVLEDEVEIAAGEPVDEAAADGPIADRAPEAKAGDAPAAEGEANEDGLPADPLLTDEEAKAAAEVKAAEEKTKAAEAARTTTDTESEAAAKVEADAKREYAELRWPPQRRPRPAPPSWTPS